MRILKWLLLLTLLPGKNFAQELHAEKDTAKVAKYDPYTEGVALYNAGYYNKAERDLQRAFDLSPNPVTASYLYYALMLQGKDLIASEFLKKNLLYTYDLPSYKKGFENIYTDDGPRISVNSNAGNMYYGDIGTTYRISSRLRFWQIFNYLQQDNNLGNFKQYETFSRLSYYIGNGWTLMPTIHYDYVPNTSLYSKADSIHDTTKYIGSYGTITYATAASDIVNYREPGYSNYTSFSIAVSKTIGAFIFEVEPSIQYNYSYYRTFYKDVIRGGTDSSVNGFAYSFSPKPYNYSDSGVVADTLTKLYVYQMGAAITYTLPIRFEPITVRFAAFYLSDNKNVSSTAYSFYSTLRFNKKCWINLSWEKMGVLPWALNYEGLYFNFNNKINSREGVSLQFHPLDKISAAFTYQYEYDTRFQDRAKLVYNSCYLSLKYNLCKK